MAAPCKALDTELVVLLVDDERDLREAIAHDIHLRGATVLEADGVDSALAVLAERKVDVIVTDVRMPKRNGLDLLATVRRGQGDQPAVVLMSGFAEIPLWDAYDRGADAFFGKPFLPEALFDRVRRLARPSAQNWSVDPGPAAAEVNLTFPNGEVVAGATGFTIGRGGMFLGLMRRDLRVGVLIGFKLTVGDAPTALQGKGLVRWVRNLPESGLAPGCGVEFSFLEPDICARLSERLAKTRPLAFIPKGPKLATP